MRAIPTATSRRGRGAKSRSTEESVLKATFPPLTAALLFVGLLAGCAGGPVVEPEAPPQSAAMPASTATFAGAAVAATAERHPQRSGFDLLDTGRDALQARVALVRSAEQSIDAQYFIWHDDTAGRLLAAALFDAAERGVRVRVLVDDFYLSGRDERIALYDAHPRIEVRVFNPVAQREYGQGRALAFLADFRRLNHRMHNKLLLVDGALGVAGGRNVGDEYFGIGDDFNMRDRDVLAAGPVVGDLARSFDHYWNSRWAVPFGRITAVSGAASVAGGDPVAGARQRTSATRRLAATLPYAVAFGSEEARDRVRSHLAALTWARAEVHYDRPESPGDAKGFSEVARALQTVFADTRDELLIQSPYLILRERALAAIEKATRSGITVAIHTNSLASTDMVPAQAHYAQTRPGLLAAGARLHELRPDAALTGRHSHRPDSDGETVPLALHAKSVVADRRIVYIGTFNLDQRSALLNTEIALIIHSPELAGEVARDILRDMHPDNSWELEPDGDGGVVWVEGGNDSIERHAAPPLASTGRQLSAVLLGLLPIDSQL